MERALREMTPEQRARAKARYEASLPSHPGVPVLYPVDDEIGAIQAPASQAAELALLLRF